ncbi:CRISPR-associated protein Cas4 [Streptomyces sp. NBC_00322]|uniref:restriction endonuclease n=1 Tax=Streptomyces sp. NBC_00322 TaxID=2975712 RepID=UPI002E27CB7B|nr:restriction endonuclease [Streptomyces sp. NBC_00322]
MSHSSPGPEFREAEFIQFLVELLRRSGYQNAQPEAAVGGNKRVDIVVDSPDEIFLIEVKRSSPQTERRVRESVAQLKHYSSLASNEAYAGRPQKLVLAIPGNLTMSTIGALSREGITVWDGAWIAEKAVAVGLAADAARFLSEEHFASSPEDQLPGMAERLAQLAPGRPAWSAYQRLCREIAEFLFCPPLRSAIWESANEAEINKRDFILPNYATEGFWKFLRDEYRAHYVVVDAKNYRDGIEKEQVLQIANYLSRHGTGLFALIMTRNEAKQSALYTMREQWILHNKMIVVLHDRDIMQMLTDKSFGNDPAELVRQKIEDFRLGI